jgi:hypothetical protein
MPSARFSETRARMLPLALIALIGCGGDGGTGPTVQDPPAAQVASITVTLAEASIEASATTLATAVVRDAQGNALTRTVTWSVDAAAVATHDGGGGFRGRVPGTATVTASVSGVSGSAVLQVRTRDIAALVEVIRAERGLPAMAGALVPATASWPRGSPGCAWPEGASP